jgi:hypothetical protein
MGASSEAHKVFLHTAVGIVGCNPFRCAGIYLRFYGSCFLLCKFRQCNGPILRPRNVKRYLLGLQINKSIVNSKEAEALLLKLKKKKKLRMKNYRKF